MTVEPMSGVKLALLANQVRAQVGDVDALAAEPIAVIGIGCRFPGGANSPEAYWRIVRDGVDAITEVPADRWDVEQFFDPDPYRAGHTNTRWGGFIDGVDQFDAAYFGISPREAARMDPQQRMVLEVATEALERAGRPADSLAGSSTGVFIGATLHDYGEHEHGGAWDIDAYSITGNAHCIIPNRLSFMLDLRGPSVAVDTACSSSLVAIHLACRSLRTRDCDLALAGGVNALLAPDPMVGLAKWGLMAADGRCKTFDARADGFVRSEGCGVVALARLSDAIAAGDPVLAIVRGSAVNQDGRSTAMTAPNGAAQRDVIRRALADGCVTPEQIGCVELHGTGTVLGDPIEVEALASVLGAAADGAPPVALTSVKTNIGHLEAASGVAGFIKAVLCLRHGQIPSPVHFERLNPHIELDDTRLVIPSSLCSWPGDRRRYAGVSSFGFGGTNAHVVLEEAPDLPAAPGDDGLPLVVLSARTPTALAAVASAVADAIEGSGDDGPELGAIAATAARRRTHHPERLAVHAPTRSDAVAGLRAFAAGRRGPATVSGHADPGARRRVAFVCSGQGNQWAGMARELLATSAVFRDRLEACDAEARSLTGWSVIDALCEPAETSRLERTEIAQPVLFGVQVGLAALWRSWGVEPYAVVGHSVGEVAAAYIAGALELRDAVRVVVTRGATMSDLHGAGAMASIECELAVVEAAIAPYGARLSIAAINAPGVVVVSGDGDAVGELTERMRSEGATVRALPVSYPFHSRLMDRSAADARSLLDGIRPVAAQLVLASTTLGSVVDGTQLDADHWAANIAAPVRFADATDALVGAGCDAFVELGPHPVLGAAITAVASASRGGAAPVVVGSLRRGRSALETMAIAAGAMHCHGVEVDWSAVWPGRRPVVELPTYPWEHQRHWSDTWQPSSTTPGAGATPTWAGAHPLAGRVLRSPAIDGALVETTLTATGVDVVRDHRVGDLTLLPGTGFVEAALAAHQLVHGGPAGGVAEVELDAALVLTDEVETSLHAHVSGADELDVVIASTIDGSTWTRHARCRILPDTQRADAVDLAAVRGRCVTRVTGAELYAVFERRGIHFGPTFRAVADVWTGVDEAVARLVAPRGVVGSGYRFHPALLDAAIHPLGAVLDGDDPVLPVGISAVRLHGSPAAEMWAHVTMRHRSATTVTADVSVVADDGSVVATVEGLRAVRTSVGALAGARSRRTDTPLRVLVPVWTPRAEVPDRHPPSGPWLVVADDAGPAGELAVALADAGIDLQRATGADVDGAERTAALVAATGATDVVDLRALDLHETEPGAETGAETGAERRATEAGVLAALTHTWLGAVESGAAVWSVTAGAQPAGTPVTTPAQAMVWGLVEGLGTEHQLARTTRVDLEPGVETATAVAQLIAALSGASEDAVAMRGEQCLVRRLEPLAEPSAPTGPSRLASSSFGRLEGLQLEPLRRREPGAGEVEIEVSYSGLNFRDVLVALDLYPDRSEVFGDECVGTVIGCGPGVTDVAPGDRVMALAPGSFATHVTTASDLVHPLPAGLTDAEAATIPITFLTAYESLWRRGRLQPGERVLVHAGAGGVGMAAIQLAQWIGAEVHATAGTDAKRALLGELGVRYVYDSRSLDFADAVLAATGGEGVDLVLNSLAGEFVDRSVDVLATGGRFIEIGRRDIWSPARMEAERPDVDYHIVFLGDLSVGAPAEIRTMFRELAPLFESGALRPLPHTTFGAARVGAAFRYMAQARHVGKVVVRQPGAGRVDGTVIVTGGLGGVGLTLARHLVAGGASALVLAGRSAPDAEVAAAVDDLRRRGVEVMVAEVDVTDRRAVRALLDRVDAELPPLSMIVHAAGVAADSVAEGLEPARFDAVLAPKVTGTRVLDELTRARPGVELVLMSAASTWLGAEGQANYVAANAFLDAIASWRVAAGAPTLSIGWGVWDRLGMTARLGTGDLDRMARRGFVPFSASAGVRAFDLAVDSDHPHVIAAAFDPTNMAARPLLAGIGAGGSLDHPHAVTTPSPPARDLLAEWAGLPAGVRRATIAAFVDDCARTVLGLPASTPIASRQPLQEIGLDSLMAVELRNAIGAVLGAPQPATLLFDHPTPEALVDHLLVAVPAGSSSAAVTARGGASDVAGVAALSDEEAEALLLAELDALEADRD